MRRVTFIITLLLILVLLPSVGTAQMGTLYYVDAATGNDNNDGLSPSSPFASVGRVNALDLDPGDSVLFARGTTYNQQLDIDVSGLEHFPITFGAYGEGALPRFRNPASTGTSIEVSGDWIVVEYLEAMHLDSDYDSNGVGHLVGFGISGADVTLQYSATDNNAIGLYLRNDSERARVLNNQIVNNHHDPDGNTGPTGVQLRGTDNEVAFNYMSGNQHPVTPSGTAFEYWQTIRSNVHHNVVMHDRKFAEMGSNGNKDAVEDPGEIHARDNVIAYNTFYTNLHRDSGNGVRGIVTRGVGPNFGPVWNTVVEHNTFVLVPETYDNEAITCGGCGSDILTLRDNIFVTTQRGAWTGGDDPVEDHNVWYDLDSGSGSQTQGFTKDASSLTVDPEVIDAANGDFSLEEASPAIGAGTDDSDIGAVPFVEIEPEESTLPDDLVAYWKLNESVGTRSDSVGTNDLSQNATVGARTGLQGNAAEIERENGEYLYVTDNAALSMGNIDFTLAVWVRFDSLPGTMGLLSKDHYANREYSLLYSTSNGRFSFHVSHNGSTITTLSANTFGQPAVDTWYLVVAWHDSVNDTINIQVNDGTVDSTAHSTGVQDGSNIMQVGRFAAIVGNQVDGLLDEAAVWKRVLAEGERTELYNGGAGMTYPFD